MKLAKSQPSEIQHLKTFLKECGWLKDELKHTELEDVDLSDFDLLKDFDKTDASKFLFQIVNEIKAMYHEKALWNLETLLENCADPKLDHLDFNAEIKAGQEAVELLKEINECLSDGSEIEIYKEKARMIINKIPLAITEAQTER